MERLTSGSAQPLRARFAPRRESILTVLIVVAVVDLLFTLDASARGHPPRLADIPAELLIYFFLSVMGYLIYLLIQAVAGLRLVVRLLIIFAACIVLGLVQPAMVQSVLSTMTDHPIRPWDGTLTLRSIQVGSMPYLFTAAALLAVDYHRAVREREDQLARSQALAEEARRLALRYEINPHFLFNALNSVSSLVLDHRNEAAEDMLLRLSTFFRHTLETADARMISLAQEIDLQAAYLDVEQARFGDSVTIEIDVPEALLDAQVPALILQPLVDNAVKHGALRGDASSLITIRAAAEDRQLVLEVVNPASGVARVGTGTGLRNVRQRLASHFGAAAALSTDTSTPGVHRARLTLPLLSGAGETT